jgi:hypothetical protein
METNLMLQLMMLTEKNLQTKKNWEVYELQVP